MLRIDSLRVELEHPIAEAFVLGELVVVLFPYEAAPRSYGAFDNLIALTRRGERAWVAELPTHGNDAWVDILSREPLVATSWSSLQCTLDPRSGKILRTDVVK